jgi:ATP-dependent 26S proteasome regulatory subunit
MLELRATGTSLCRLIHAWLDTSSGIGAAVGPLLAACRGQLRGLTGRVVGIDDGPGPRSLDEEEQGLRARLEHGPTDTPFARLRRNAALDRLDTDVLLLAALPDESALWSALFQAIGGPTCLRPTVHLLLNLWAGTPAERRAAHHRLCTGPLARLQLVRIVSPDLPFASRQIHLADDLWPTLLGAHEHRSALPHVVVHAANELALPIMGEGAARDTAALATRLADERGVRLVVRGPQGSGRSDIARWLAGRLAPCVVEARWPAAAPDPGWVAGLAREVLVRDAALVLFGSADAREALQVEIELPASVPVFVVTTERAEVLGSTFAEAHELRLSRPRTQERELRWRAALAEQGVPGPEPAELARDHRLRSAEVSTTVSAAIRCAQLAGRSEVTADDVARVVRARPARQLEALARRHSPRGTFSDLVLPGKQVAQLQCLIERVRHRELVFEEWGVAGQSGRQLGVTALFSGPSGTGKTLAAEIVAGQLGLDLYCVDLAEVVSKYIGETEKGLARIFDAAAAASAVLFFDEADALFGKRSETRDAHDRYANQEVSYLLTRLESFDGITILASNLRQNIDPAFLRRLDFLVEFTQPDIPSRARIWERHLDGKLPVGPDVDLVWLAETFSISGANIRNVVVAAAFGAAADGKVIRRSHLEEALRGEYDKVGRLFPDTP